MAAPANSVESEMATEYYYEQCRVFPDFPPSPPRLPFPPSPPRLPFSPSLPQNQEHDDILVHPDASTVTPPYVAGGSDPSFLTICQEVIPDFRPLPPWPSPSPFSPSLPQNQEHDNILVHPDASTVTPIRNRKRKQRSRKNKEHDDDIPFGPSPPQLPFSPLLPQIQEHDYDDILALSPPQNQEHNDDDIQRLPPLAFSPLLPQNQEHDDDYYIRLLQSYKNQEQEHEEFWRLNSLSPLLLPQNQEHDNILVHPDASTVTPIRNRKRKQRSRKNKEHDDDIPFGPSPPQLPFSPLLPQIQEHDYDDILALSPPQNQEHNDDDIRRLPPLPFSPSLPQNQEHDDDDYYIWLLQSYKNQEQEHKEFWWLNSLSPLLLPQNQEHDNILVHPDASTVTPIRKRKRKRERKQRSRKSNGRTSSGVGSDDKFNQGVDESVDGRTIGKLFVSNREIAKGSNGTIVLEGTHEVRPVAVKRLVKAYHDVADKEYQNLCVSDRHSNIVRLYGVEEDKDFVYLALERCTGSLNDLIQMQFLDAPTANGDQATEVNIQYKVHLQSMKGTLPEVKLWEDNGYPSPTLWKLMRDMVSGLVHLHELGMVHRDLKPQNVLIVKEGSICAKLSDMGISKRLVGDKSSLGNHATGCGTSGWQAPELLRRHGRQTLAIDVFSLGCILFYCISGGKHPFGDPLVRDVNIDSGKVKLFLVKHIPEAMDLLDHLLDRKAELRPKASEVLIHPMFWDSDKRLSFLRDASDRVQQEDSGSAILKELEHRAPRVLGTKPASKRGKNMVLLNWDEKIDPSLLNDIDNPRWYYYDRVRDLLRFIRNKKNHFFDLSHEIQEILGPVPKGFDGYFRSRFPKLLMEVYKVLHKYCREEEWCNKYFKGSVD